MDSTKIVLNIVKNLDENERIFLICDKCLWNATCLSASCKQKVLEISNFCPVCNYDRLTRFPLITGDYTEYNCSKYED